ncbi:MAG: iron-containing alcohol dehydrogenase [Syntrophobacteraceae bacterium]
MSAILQNKAHVFFSPHKIIFGQGTTAQVGTEAKLLGATKVLIITDPGVVKADLLKPVTDSLSSAGLSYSVYGKVEPEPPTRVVDEAADHFQSESCNFVLGIGGGSSLDVAKGVSILAGNGGHILDYFGMDQVSKPAVPKILMPTTSGTGSETTRVLVVTDESANAKQVVYSLYCLPEVAIVDPRLTFTMPTSVTADTGMDALVHAIETYVSMNASPFSDILAEKAIAWIGHYLPIAWAKGSNEEARYYMSLAATLSGMAFASGGLGAVHGLSYVLGTRYHMPHGRSNAIMLPHVMRYNLPGAPAKYASVAALLGNVTTGLSVNEAAALSVEAIENLLTIIQIPICLDAYGIPKEDIPHLVEGGIKQSRLFATNPRDLSEKDVKDIYANCF